MQKNHPVVIGTLGLHHSHACFINKSGLPICNQSMILDKKNEVQKIVRYLWSISIHRHQIQYWHRQTHYDTDIFTLIIMIIKIELIECNHMFWCHVRHIHVFNLKFWSYTVHVATNIRHNIDTRTYTIEDTMFWLFLDDYNTCRATQFM